MRLSRIAGALLCALLPLLAVETQTWEHSSAADFEKGTTKQLSLSSDGHLSAAPLLRQIHDPSLTYLWAIARDSKGVLYAGGGGLSGSKAKLVAIDNAGQVRTMELDGLAVQAIAIDKQNRVYAATSPDGKIYRVSGTGQPQEFYDPKAKYIWAMAFSKTGDLYVGTGDAGEIHKVTESGAGSVFYRTEETNVRSLAIDANDNVIAGTDASGLVLRIPTTGPNAGQGFILYEAPKREVTAVAIAPDGNIYAAATGNKTAATAPAAPAATRQVQTSQGAIALAIPVNASARGAAQTPAPTVPAGVAGGSEIYRIQADGYARKVWNHAQDVVYALAFDAQGHLVFGTGNQENVYRLDGDHSYTRLLKVTAAQVTALAPGPNGRLYLATGNIGEIFAMGPERESSGTYESEVLDGGEFSYWGRLTEAHSGQGDISVETRSGNVSRAQKDWSPWAKLKEGRAVSPAARFLQYRATVSGDAQLSSVTTAYEMKNVPPVLSNVEATPANYKFPAPAVADAVTTPGPLTLPALGRRITASSKTATDTNYPALTFSKGSIGARWAASDENGDTLRFSLEIRGENETAWKPLRENLREHYYSWDSTAFPDGKYRVRVTASDAPANPPGQALTASHESEVFLIDNTAPEITGLTASNGMAHFHAKDAGNVLDKAEYSVNGGEWQVVEPTTRLTDSQEHDYQFQISSSSSEIVVAVRVKDANQNEATAKTVVK